MNIFFLSLNKAECARFYFNKHCVKIILEIAQVLYCAHWTNNLTDDWITTHKNSLNLNVYKKTHANHPMTKWVREHINNYTFACQLGLELCYEYSRRYHNKVHACQIRLEWLLNNKPDKFQVQDYIKSVRTSVNIPRGCTPVPLCMPEEYHHNDLLMSYRTYYIKAKSSIAESHLKLEYLKDIWNM